MEPGDSEDFIYIYTVDVLFEESSIKPRGHSLNSMALNIYIYIYIYI